MSMNIGTVTDNTMFFRVHFGVLGNSRQVSNKAVLKTDANTKLLKIQKTLLESPELEAIKKADAATRSRVVKLCLPYPDMAIMLAPVDLSDDIDAILLDYQENIRPELVNAFVDMYPQRVTEARTKTEELAAELNISFDVLWNATSYPSPDLVRDEFSFDWQYLTFMTPEALKAKGKYEQEKEKQIAKLAVAADEITLLMRSTLAELVNHLKEALQPSADGKKKRLYASTVTNIQEFLKTLPARNVTGDKELANLAAQVNALITPGLDVETIKKDDSFKASILAGVESLGSALNSLVEEVPGRKFRTDL